MHHRSDRNLNSIFSHLIFWNDEDKRATKWMDGNDSNEFDSSYLEILLVNCHATELYSHGLIIFRNIHHSNLFK